MSKAQSSRVLGLSQIILCRVRIWYRNLFFVHSFLPRHRHPETHNCPSQVIVTTPPKSQFSAVGQKPLRNRRAKPPTDPTKLLQWQRMDVMKTRHRAVCGDPKDKTASLPPDQRLHVKIQLQQADKVFWFRKVRNWQIFNTI